MDIGSSIEIPVGLETLGRILNNVNELSDERACNKEFSYKGLRSGDVNTHPRGFKGYGEVSAFGEGGTRVDSGRNVKVPEGRVEWNTPLKHARSS